MRANYAVLRCEEVVYWGLSETGKPYDLLRVRLGPAAAALEVAQSVGYCGA